MDGWMNFTHSELYMCREKYRNCFIMVNLHAFCCLTKRHISHYFQSLKWLICSAVNCCHI